MTGDSGKVANINIKRLVTGHYPWLKLSAEFKDENGASVYAVPASHIAATIAGQSVPLVVRNNLPVAPRIILLIDTSTSVAPEYRGNNIEILVKELAGRILAKWPDAQFKIGIAGGSGASFMHWTHDLDDLAANTHHMALESPLWRSYARAVEQKPDAIVFVTDGQAISHQFGIVNTLPEELKPIYNIAPPTVVLGAGTEKYPLGPAFKGIAEASNGIALDIKDVKKSAELVNEFLRERIVPYELWVNAGALKEVQASSETLLTLSAGNAVGEKSFVIPNLNERAFGQSISGLYLKIDSHYGTTTRRLAGAMLGTKSPSESDKMNAQMGLFGRYSLMIEAGSPSLAQQLDDVISSRLSWQPVIEAKDLKQSKMALQQAYTLPSSRFSFSLPLQHLVRTELPVIDLGPRFWLESEQQVKNGEGNELHQKRIDIVPLTRFFSLQKSPDKRLADTLRASLVLSDIESAITQQSGLKYLNTEHSALDLMWAEFGLNDRQRNDAFYRLKAGWPHFMAYLVPKAGDLKAAMAIDKFTGTTLSMLDDGSGGGITESEVNANFDAIDNVLGFIASNGSPGLQSWASLEQAKMDKLRTATLTILKMEAPSLEDMIRDKACEAASDAVDSLIDSGLNVVGGSTAVELRSDIAEAIERANELAEALGFGGVDASLTIPGCE
jgi:hypothetical protein